MRLTWLLPGGLWLGTLVALPIVVHLLARRRRPLRFPTLRFVVASSAPARRHWPQREPRLLAVRVALVLATAAAVAAPLLVTAGRQARWDAPLARAVVVAPEVVAQAAEVVPAMAAPEGEERRFVTGDLPAGLADAAAWLQTHGRSRREISVMAPFLRGSIGERDVRLVPADIGLRFVRVGLRPSGTFERTRVQRVDGQLWRIGEAVTLDAAGTAVRESGRVAEPGQVVAVASAPADREAAAAARRAVLRRGVALASPETALVTVPWPGDVTTLAAAIDARSGGTSAGSQEPAAIDDAVLAAMTRPAAPRGPSAPIDEGDRRLVWLCVLVLLGVETWVRRRPA